MNYAQLERTLHQARNILSQTKLTTSLVVVNVLVFIPSTLSPRAFRHFEITQFQLDYSIRTFDIAHQGEWWRLFTGAFLHDGFVHLAANMLLTWILGQALERRLGTARFFGLYFGSLLAGSLGVMLLEDPNRWTVGASGAVFGLLAGAVVMHRMLNDAFKISGLLLLLGIELGLTFLFEGVSQGGHLGGAIGGLALGFCYLVVNYMSQNRYSKALANPSADFNHAKVAIGLYRREVVVSAAVAGVLGVLFLLGSLWAAERSVADVDALQQDALPACLDINRTWSDVQFCLQVYDIATT